MVEIIGNENEFDDSKFISFCEENRFEFPKAYIEYLRADNDSDLEANCVELAGNDTSIRYFYGTSAQEYSDLKYTYDIFRDRLPLNCVPIATDAFGNQFCISLCAETYGKIYFWDHEVMDTNEGEKATLEIVDLIWVADSFDELCAKIKAANADDIPHYSWLQAKWNRFVSWLRTLGNKL